MAQKDILPAVSNYARSLAEAALAKRTLSDTMDVSFETGLATKISRLTAQMNEKNIALGNAVAKAEAIEDNLEQARFYHDTVLANMEALRAVADELESLCASEYWPLPSYGDLLFSVK
jgi:glutamine synthetase